MFKITSNIRRNNDLLEFQWKFVHGVVSLVLLDGRLQLVVVGPAELVDLVAALDEHEGGQRLDVVLFGELGQFIDIDLKRQIAIIHVL